MTADWLIWNKNILPVQSTSFKAQKNYHIMNTSKIGFWQTFGNDLDNFKVKKSVIFHL